MMPSKRPMPPPMLNPMPMEPDADQRGGKSDKDQDDKGFMRLRYRGKKKSKGKSAK